MTLSNRASSIKPSATLALNAKTKKLKASGGDIISLGAGEPDFDTPQHIKDAAINAINEGFTKYTAVDGYAELKESIIEKFERENALKFVNNQIIVSTGAKQCLYNAMQALLNPGDEVIIPIPYWVSYPDMCKLAEGVPCFVKSSVNQNFKISAEQLEAAITEKSRIFILNSPSNPSGMVYNKQELEELASVLIKHPQIYILSDDIYEHILWTHKPFLSILNVCSELADRTIVINGVSKAYSMTGWRIGYAAGPEDIITGMRKIQSQSTSSTCSIAQKAAFSALKSDQQCVQEMVKSFKQRHDLVVNGLQEIDGVECRASHGTFYTFPNIANIIERLPKINSDLEFADSLLAKTGVAVVPGTAFGDPQCIRISYATSIDKLNDALIRIKTFVENY